MKGIKDKVDEALEKKIKAAERGALGEIAIIQQRTVAGQNVEGAPFKAYSPSYAKVRERNNDQVSPPNLTITGDMLSSIRLGQTERRKEGAIIIITPNDQVQANKIAGNDKIRKFFGLSEQQRQRIIDQINKG